LAIIGLRERLVTILLVAVVGVAVGAVRRERWLLWLDVALAAVIAVVSFTPVLDGHVQRWVRSDSLPDRADAIIALSGDVRSGLALDPVGTDRLVTAVELFHAGKAPRIVTTRIVHRYG